MARVSSKMVNSAFGGFLYEIGGRKASGYNDVGGYRLDYNPVYGGYVVEEIMNAGGGVRRPFGETRQTSSVMFDTLRFATSALEVANRQSQNAA